MEASQAPYNMHSQLFQNACSIQWLENIRNLRAEKESMRLQQLIEYDIQEVQLREKLFKQYCVSLEVVYTN